MVNVLENQCGIQVFLFMSWKLWILAEILSVTSYGLLGFLQIAGGTNSHTIDKLKQAGLFQKMRTDGMCFLGLPALLHAIFRTYIWKLLRTHVRSWAVGDNEKTQRFWLILHF